MRAGAASVDITPDDVRNTYMAGFGMARRAKGVHMPLRATALYLAAEQGPGVVLVSLDLVGLLKVWIDRIRAQVTAVDGAKVVIACTHTHAGPDTLGYWGPSIFKVFPRSDGKNPAYMHRLVRSVAACIDTAVAAARDVSMRVTTFAGDSEWTRNDRKGGGRYDDVVAACFDNEHGTRVATLVNYASHPEALWEHNRLLSPDFVGPLRDRIIGDRGGEVVYWSGPLGAMLTPNCQAGPKDVDARVAYIEALGSEIGATVVAALDEAPSLKPPALLHEALPVRFDNANWRYRLLERLGLVDVVTNGKQVHSQVHSLRVGPLTIATAPGEVCPELGVRLRDAMPGEHRMVVTLCEDEFGYILEPSLFDETEYAYEASMSLGRKTADVLLGAYPWS